MKLLSQNSFFVNNKKSENLFTELKKPSDKWHLTIQETLIPEDPLTFALLLLILNLLHPILKTPKSAHLLLPPGKTLN